MVGGSIMFWLNEGVDVLNEKFLIRFKRWKEECGERRGRGYITFYWEMRWSKLFVSNEVRLLIPFVEEIDGYFWEKIVEWLLTDNIGFEIDVESFGL